MENFLNLPELSKLIEGASNRILDYAVLLAAVGTVTMALIELIKGVTRGRMWFHWLMVKKWIGWKNDQALNELFALAIGGSENANALYDQPTGKMLGQLQAAANVALDFPKVYPAFYEFLTAGAVTVGTVNDREKWRNFSQKIIQPRPTDASAIAAFEQDSRESTQARARLGNLVTRKLDAFQTRVEYTWARFNQLLALIAGSVFFYCVLSRTKDVTKISMFTLVVVSLMGGLIAPFAKDVVTALTGLRARRT